MRRRLGREQDAAYFSHISKDVQENTSSDTNIVLEAVGQIWFLRKIDQKSKITQVEISWVEVENLISTPNYIYLRNFKILGKKFKNRIPRELDQNMDIPRISVNH